MARSTTLAAHDEVLRGAIEAHGYLLSGHTPTLRGPSGS